MRPSRRRLFRLPMTERTVAAEVADELAFHVDSRMAELVAMGRSPADARAQALREFGDTGAARDELTQLGMDRMRRQRRIDAFDSIRHDTRLIVRSLFRERLFALAVIVTLGLGIGVNAAMFGITDRLLFRAPHGIAEPESVKRVFFSETTPWAGFVQRRFTNWPDYEALRTGVTGFSDLAAYFNSDAPVGRGSKARKVRWSLATANLFPVLGAAPHVGRFYTPAEDRPDAATAVAVLGHRYWQQEYGGDTSVLGAELLIGTKSYTVIGVAPPGFNGAEYEPVDVYVPLHVAGPAMQGEDWNTRNIGWIRLVGRLKEGANLEQLRTQATTILRRENPHVSADDATLAVTAEPIILARAPQERSSTTAATARISLWLSGLSLMVLLIACANVINLLLVRVSRRQREVSIRMALGVGRWRLVRYSLLETLVLAGLSGAAGLAFANWAGALIRHMLLPDMDWSTGALDARALAYTALLVVGCALIAAIAPTLQSLRTDLSTVLKSGARAGARRSIVRNALIGLQAATSVVLLIIAGLFVRSQLNLRNMEKGFDPDRVMAMNWDSELLDQSGVEADALFRAVADRLRGLPGVENAAVSMTSPFWSSMSASNLRAQGVDSIPQIENAGPYFNAVSPEFFSTLGTDIVRGRAFNATDVAGAPKVAIISETMARLLWPRDNPLGKCIYRGEESCRTIVGVAQDALNNAIEGDVMMLYMPLAQFPPSGFRTVFIRAHADPVQLQPAIRRAVIELRADMPYTDIRLLSDLMSPHVRQWQLGAVLFTAFGILALLLAALGLYSVIAYAVAQRTRELSVRMALGARARHLVELVVGNAARVVLTGIACGLLVALYAAMRMSDLLFHVDAWDRSVYATVVAVLITVGAAAAFIPALRAIRVEPSRALSEE